MKKGVKPTIQNSKPKNLSQVNWGNNLFEINREKIWSDIFYPYSSSVMSPTLIALAGMIKHE